MNELSAKQMFIGETSLCTPSFLPLIQLPFPWTVPLLRTPDWQISLILSAALLVLKLGNEGLSDLVKPVLELNCSLNHVSLSKDNLNS